MKDKVDFWDGFNLGLLVAMVMFVMTLWSCSEEDYQPQPTTVKLEKVYLDVEMTAFHYGHNITLGDTFIPRTMSDVKAITLVEGRVDRDPADRFKVYGSTVLHKWYEGNKTQMVLARVYTYIDRKYYEDWQNDFGS